jgi:error-prone DNA polymerase
MKQVVVQLREGMARQGIAGEAAEQIVMSIASFALYGFPESHAASFALLAYASAFLKVHYPAAFYTALLNNQPMGFYHPSTLVKDAQRRGVRFHPIDAQVSGWDCTVEADGAIRLGLRYVSGLRQEVGKKIATASADTRGRESRLEAEGVRSSASARGWGPARSKDSPAICPKCGCDDGRCSSASIGALVLQNCSHDWPAFAAAPRRAASSTTSSHAIGLRRDEPGTLADIGALNSLATIAVPRCGRSSVQWPSQLFSMQSSRA